MTDWILKQVQDNENSSRNLKIAVLDLVEQVGIVLEFGVPAALLDLGGGAAVERTTRSALECAAGLTAWLFAALGWHNLKAWRAIRRCVRRRSVVQLAKHEPANEPNDQCYR